MGINYNEKKKRFEIDSFGKYINDDFKVIKGIFEDKKIRFTQPLALNDPLEFKPVIKFKSDKIKPYDKFLFNETEMPTLHFFTHKLLIEIPINKYGILSLTKVPDSFNMWNMYSNGHKGFFIELKKDFNKHKFMLNKSGNPYMIEEVKYKDNYFIELDRIITVDNFQEVYNKVKNEIFYYKTSRWSEENEYRLVRDLNDNQDFPNSEIYLFDFSSECISSIVFGASMNIKNKEFIKNKCDDFNIEFYQSFIMKDEKDHNNKVGKVVIHKIGEGDFSWARMISMDPFLFMGNLEELSGTTKVINKLEDLPYFNGNEEFVKDLYSQIKNGS